MKHTVVLLSSLKSEQYTGSKTSRMYDNDVMQVANISWRIPKVSYHVGSILLSALRFSIIVSSIYSRCDEWIKSVVCEVQISLIIGAFLKTQKHKFVICDTNFVNVPAAR
jgi:hypothetical protein